MNVRCTTLLGVLLFAAACSQTPAQSPIAKVAGPHPATVRAVAGSVWVGKTTVSEPHSAWELPAQGEVADLDVMPLGESAASRPSARGCPWGGASR